MTLPGDTSWRVRPAAAVALVLIAAWAVFFAGELFTDVVPYHRDGVLLWLPTRQFIYERLREGQFPQWYPYEALGVPLAGQLTVGLFHPATYMLLWLDYARALKWNLLLSFLVALAGAYRWARAQGASRHASVAAAFSYGFGGYALGTSSNFHYTMALATLPWVGWALAGVVRRGRADYLAWLGLCWGLIFLSGDPQGLLLSTALVPLALLKAPTLAAVRRPLVFCLLAGALAGLLASPDLLPGQVLFAESVRVLGHPRADLASFWALPPLRLLELVTPGFLPDAVLEPALAQVLRAGPAVFSTTVFAGAVTLALAAAGARGRVNLGYAALALLALWLALGDSGGLLPLLQKVVRPLGRMRYPEKYLAFFWLALVPLVAAGADRLRAEGRRFRLPLGIGAAGLLALALLAPSLAAARTADAALALALGSAWRGGLLVSAALLAALSFASAASPRVAGLGLPVLLFAELLNGNGAYLPMAPRALLEQVPSVAAQLQALAAPHGPPPRVLSLVPFPRDTASNPDPGDTVVRTLAGLFPDSSGLYGVSSLGPRIAGFSLRYERLLGAANERAQLYGPWVNACHAVVPAGDSGLTQLEALPCRGPAFLAGAVTRHTPGQVLGWLQSHPAGGDTVAWEGGPALAPPSGGTVGWVSWAPEALELSVDSPSPAALVVADELTPGWSATVDGAPAPIYPTLLALRGVEVPAGHHRVRFEYHTPLLQLGLTLSAAGLAASAALLALGLRRRRRQRAA